MDPIDLKGAEATSLWSLPPLMESSSTAFIFKGKVYSGAISGDLSILDLHIEFSNFSDSQILKGLGCRFYSILGSFLPRNTACSYQFNNFVS
jgi:hypothetical protein